ncbi:c-8 sterol isomerase [Moniliophthora roreri MCA 2997]|uniref:C-8 sterol isomerase n=1 Tax=Moniliophthora roreri (strain MCA 2997) TaxID=1381753 RepID=V2XD06_MONRO|nr:c-8 sterol isomerase [Moniliophthora roreri MCA 2997]
MTIAKKSSTDSQKPPARTSITKWAVFLGLAYLFVQGLRWLDTIKHRWYVLDPTFLHQLAQDSIAASPDSTSGMIDHIITNLTSTYTPQQIRLNTNTSEWVFNNAGGAMGAMYIIHASITEYLIVFGTPLGTEGHSGLHTGDDYFNILVGEQWAFAPGELEKRVYPAGTVNHLPRGKTIQYKMHEGCFALEYVRGWIPPMLPFGFADTFTSTLDYVSLWTTVKWTAREMIGNLLVGKI